MIALRFEILRLVEPWAQPQSGLLGVPLLSGTIARDDVALTDDPASLYAPAEPIAVPAALEGERSYLLALEVFGGRGWYVTFGTPAQPPQPTDGEMHPTDPHPAVYVPSGGIAGASRSREVRAVRPGSLFLVQPART